MTQPEEYSLNPASYAIAKKRTLSSRIDRRSGANLYEGGELSISGTMQDATLGAPALRGTHFPLFIALRPPFLTNLL